jgi:hypothetical protein
MSTTPTTLTETDTTTITVRTCAGVSPGRVAVIVRGVSDADFARLDRNARNARVWRRCDGTGAICLVAPARGAAAVAQARRVLGI